MSDINRRTFVKGAGVAGAAALFGAGAAGADVSTRVIDDQFDMTGGLQETLVVFDSAEDARRLAELDHEEGFRIFEHLGIGHTVLTPAQVETVAEWDSVRRVKRSEKLEYLNDETSRESMNVPPVHEHDDDASGYVGEDAHIVIIDSGLDGSHPAFQGRIEANYKYVDQPFGSRDPLWVDAGNAPTDEVGHGTHCTGIAAGDGSGATSGDYHGMAPAATITSYSTTQWQYLPYAVAAWNHMLGRVKDPMDEFDPDVVTNSYGVARRAAYNPNDPLNVATWEAFQEGLFVAFAHGNDGALGTGNRYSKAPHVMGVAATEKTISPDDNANNRPVTGFSSRGREYDPAKAESEPTKYIANRVYHNREQMMQNLREFHAIQDGAAYTVGSETRSGRVGGAVNGDPVLLGFIDEETSAAQAYEQFTAQGNADLTSLTLSLEPEGQWVRLRVYEKQDDGEWVKIAAAREEIFKKHDVLPFDVDGGREYLVSLEAEDAVVANYELEIEQSARPDGDLRDARPLTLFRPGIGTHGNAVMSTVQPGSILGPLGLEPQEPLYGRLSGTSMATPACAGIAALCYQAYRDVAGADPDPLDIIRIIESTALDANPEYTPANVGSGFIDAGEAVATTEALAAGDTDVTDLETGFDALVEDVPPTTPEEPVEPSLTAEGSRADDGHAFTGGGTNHVKVTLSDLSWEDVEIDGSETVEIIEEIPQEWTVDERWGDVEKQWVDKGTGRRKVKLQPTIRSEVDDNGESVTREYFAEAPESTEEMGSYTFGPALAETEGVSDDGNDVTLSDTFAGTDENYVGPSQNQG